MSDDIRATITIEQGSAPLSGEWQTATVCQVRLNDDGTATLALRVEYEVDEAQVIALVKEGGLPHSVDLVRSFLRNHGPIRAREAFLRFAAEQAR